MTNIAKQIVDAVNKLRKLKALTKEVEVTVIVPHEAMLWEADEEVCKAINAKRFQITVDEKNQRYAKDGTGYIIGLDYLDDVVTAVAWIKELDDASS